MDEIAFRTFLKRSGRKPNVQDRVISHVTAYAQYLAAQRNGVTPDQAVREDLEAYVAWIEREPKASAKPSLWAIRYYYAFTGNEEMRNRASVLREERIKTKRRPFQLKKFHGVDPEYVAKLAAAGITNVEQMLTAGATSAERQALADKSGVPPDAVCEFVKLSDLARLDGVKGIRARLYYDAGVDTLEKMAAWDPQALRAMLLDFVERTGFEGIAPLPKEAANSVKTAKLLPKIVEYAPN